MSEGFFCVMSSLVGEWCEVRALARVCVCVRARVCVRVCVCVCVCGHTHEL